MSAIRDEEPARMQTAAKLGAGLAGGSIPTRAWSLSLASLAVILGLCLSPAVAAASVSASGGASEGAVRQKFVPLAQKILTLARSKSPHVHFTLGGRLTGYYEVEVKITATKSVAAQALQDYYSFYASFPRPAGSAVNVVRASDFSKLHARNAVGVVINGGAQQLILQRNTYPPFVPRFHSSFPPGWFFHGDYNNSSGGFTMIGAATRPELKHQTVLTSLRLASVAAQATQLLTEAASDEPTSFLSPAFAHLAGENTAAPPPLY
jgi:hypothetical protein